MAVPPGPMAVMVYLVALAVGDTGIDPFKSTFPIPLSMETVSAFTEVHVSVEESPNIIYSGLAVKLTLGITVTVTSSVNVPSGPVAVIIYVVVSAGDTVIDPLTSTLPIPGAISQVSICFEYQERVVPSPNLTVSGAALMCTGRIE